MKLPGQIFYGVTILAKTHGKQAVKHQGAKKPPITSHPLFTPIIALWFGALFGLGSLAIRPGLIEALVLKLQIDLIVPAAAPPLGITARLLLSLGMALVGGIVGALIARRMTRAKPAVRERKRGAMQSSAAPAESPSFAAESGLQQASRRRALAMDEEHGPVYDQELAPLPGGAPQILDVTEFDFSRREDERAAPVAIAPHALAETDDRASALDLSGFLSTDDTPDHAIPSENGNAMMEDHRSFAAPLERAFEGRGFADPALPAADRPAQAYAPPPFEVPAASPVPEFRPQEFHGAESRPFGAPAAGSAPFAAPMHFAVPPVEEDGSDSPSGPVAGIAPAATEEAAPIPAPMSAAVSRGEAIVRDAVERIVSTDLSELSQLQLIERLAHSLQRRRAAPVDVPPGPATPAPMPASTPAEAPAAREAEEPPQPAIPAMPRINPFAPEASQAPELFEPAPMAMPAALRPITFEDAPEEDDLAVSIPLRRIALTDGPALAGSTLAGLGEGHAMAVEPEPAAIQSEPAAPNPLARFALAPEAEIHGLEGSDQDEGLLADGYSSLLDLSRPPHQRSNFVRIEEPEEAAPAVEPVVIFPGHAQRMQAAFGAPSGQMPSAPAATSAAPSEGMAAMRRFDAPVSASTPTHPVSSAALPPQDPAETERALRTALSTLQRMSATG